MVTWYLVMKKMRPDELIYNNDIKLLFVYIYNIITLKDRLLNFKAYQEVHSKWKQKN